MGIPIKNKKKERKKKNKESFHRILHIVINLGSKFQPQETILLFGTNFGNKCYFWSKTEKEQTPSINSSYSKYQFLA